MDSYSPGLVNQRICMPLLQASAAAVKRTSASEEDSKNGRLHRTLMRMDRTLDPKRCLPRQLERCHVQTGEAVAYGLIHHSLLCPNEGRSLSNMSTSSEREAKLVRVKRLCFMLPSASLRVYCMILMPLFGTAALPRSAFFCWRGLSAHVRVCVCSHCIKASMMDQQAWVGYCQAQPHAVGTSHARLFIGASARISIDISQAVSTHAT